MHCTADIYSCDEAIRRLNEYLDHELNDQERMIVIRHLELCKPCFSRFTFEQTLVISLRQKVALLRVPEPLKEKLRILLHDSGSDE
jgi:anti-sigma factor (TIGR02949 family)